MKCASPSARLHTQRGYLFPPVHDPTSSSQTLTRRSLGPCNRACAHPLQGCMCGRHLLLRGSSWRKHTKCNWRAPEDLNAWSNATFLVVSGTIAVIRTANLLLLLYLVLRKMHMITSTSPVPE